MTENALKQATTPEETLRSTLKTLPKGPGIYRFYNEHHKLLYVGKAKNLKNRVSSYFNNRGRHASTKTELLVAKIHFLETVLTKSEHEALILEDNLIKTHRPPYNIRLKDDKRYPWIILTDEDYPRLLITRRRPSSKKRKGKENDTAQQKAEYFGPYSDVSAMYDAVRMIRKHFPLRQRKKPLFPNRPCMNYHIGTCPGPCQQLVTEKDYNTTLDQIRLFLKGHTDTLLAELEADMATASEALNFEWAAKLRDRHQAVETALHKRQMVNLNQPDAFWDVIGVASSGQHRGNNTSTSATQQLVFVIWKVRHGKVIDSTTHPVECDQQTSVDEALDEFLTQVYADVLPDDLPHEIIVPTPPSDDDTRQWLGQWLAETSPTKKSVIPISQAKRGSKKELLDRACQNADKALQLTTTDNQQAHTALADLQDALGLAEPPSRIECYDISHIQGRYTVASMVVFTNGKPDKAQYRRFNIECAEGKPDDFASMHEALRRRAKHMPNNTIRTSRNKAAWPVPDLMIIDGGKGQLSAARDAMETYGMADVPTISLAKRLEEVFWPEESQPTLLPRDSQALFLLQQIRDEAHRFAITHHRKRRGKAATESELDGIPGLGQKRREQLIAAFPNIQAIQAARIDELISVGKLPQKVAQAVWEHFHR